MMRVITTSLFVALAALPSFAQQTLIETIEVRVANIDVVVHDRAGNPVTGLTKDDFELYDDKVPQAITNFYEVRRSEETGAPRDAAAEVPLEVRQQRIVVFVDASSLTPARTASVLASVQKFIDNRMRPEDRVMLVVWRMGLHVITPFSNDKDALKRGLAEIARYGPAGDSNVRAIANVRRNIADLFDTAEREQGAARALITWEQAYAQSRAFVDRYAQQLLVHQSHLIDAIDDVAGGMAGLDGKKVLLFVGEYFAEHPAAELYGYVEHLFADHLDRNDLTNFESLTGTIGDTMPGEIEQLARDAAGNGVTIYAIGVASGDKDVTGENDRESDFGYAFSRDANTATALQRVAELTGGVAITRTSNFDLAFDTIQRDLASYYSLGYRPAGEGMRQHKIRVRTKNRAYTVRARQTFVAKSTDDQMTDRVIANLYVDPAKNEWPIAIRTGLPKSDGKRFVVPVQIVIPATVTLLPDARENLAGNFTMYFVVGDPNGATSTVLRRPETINIPKNLEATARAKPMLFNTLLRVNPGESTLSVAIIDWLSGTVGFARTKLAAK